MAVRQQIQLQKGYADRGRRNSTFLEGQDKSHEAQVSLVICRNSVQSEVSDHPLPCSRWVRNRSSWVQSSPRPPSEQREPPGGVVYINTHTSSSSTEDTLGFLSSLKRNVVLCNISKNYNNNENSLKGIFQKGKICTADTHSTVSQMSNISNFPCSMAFMNLVYTHTQQLLHKVTHQQCTKNICNAMTSIPSLEKNVYTKQ